MKSSRIVMCAKDVQQIFGISPRHSRRKLQEAKTKLNKEKHHKITVNEFSIYYNIPYEEIIRILKY